MAWTKSAGGYSVRATKGYQGYTTNLVLRGAEVVGSLIEKKPDLTLTAMSKTIAKVSEDGAVVTSFHFPRKKIV